MFHSNSKWEARNTLLVLQYEGVDAAFCGKWRSDDNANWIM